MPSSIILAAALLAVPVQVQATVPPDVRALHERLLVLDTHLDTPALLARPGWDILKRHSVAEDGSQVDYPRLVEGGLDGGWWAVYTPQGPLTPEATEAALTAARERLRLIHRLVEANPDKFALAATSADAAVIAGSGRRVVYASIENAYPLTGRLETLKEFHDGGVRMLGLVHFANNELADSATDPAGPKWHGLSPEGRRFVAEANRLGMLLDASHASDDVFDQLIAYSATPIILSHSGPRAVHDHPRNIDDARLRRLAASGGVIQINTLGAYLKPLPETPEREAALTELRHEFGPASRLNLQQGEVYFQRLRALNAAHPPAQADFEDVVLHLLHVLNLIGPRHVGVGADWDGGGGVTGLQDVAALPRLTERLLAEGYSETDLADIWGGNALRLLKAAEDHAATLRTASPSPSN
ncbi:MAG: dipeptidase [Candidatus Brevundimonas colombiensis]|uniref:Dipeptidase n=1 Tax=Candidatus Brevundimonas colombiensis TaxID=3121376 RepID=A0AAJ5X4Z7_9CAUL|nr:dipeptidase [Brevundimonas sp.]WEK40485.1 MAG: dipeptidase [Brevundimonas sp.]